MELRIVPTKVHGALDYATVPALAIAPDVLHLNGMRSSSLIPRAVAAAGAVVAPLSDYELGVKRVIPMRLHLAVDALGGLALAGGPWLTGSARQGTKYWLPHAAIGALEVALAATSKTKPSAPGRGRSGAIVAGGAAAGAVAAAAIGLLLSRRSSAS
jgi:hypothetical protein